jgi:endonuclease YncB( thermonuclease family)
MNFLKSYCWCSCLFKPFASIYSSSTKINFEHDNNIDIFPDTDSITFDYLQNITYKDTIPFIPPIKEGKVIKVYDGDTITIASKLPYDISSIYRFSIRLRGIDSPEIKYKTNAEKLLAIKSRDALSNMILNKKVYLKNIGNEKYGRILADVYIDNIHINKWMIDNKYAVKYNGGTKNRPPEWEE